MPIVIRNGTLLTMLDNEPLQSDILIEGGRIQRIGKRIAVSENTRSLDASGCVITPGLIDLHIDAADEEHEDIQRMTVRSGVTSGLCWPERQGECRGFGAAASKRYARIDPESWTDDGLRSELNRMYTEECCIPVIEVYDAAMCRRILNTCKETGVRVLLAGLAGCENLRDDIARSGCSVVIGAYQSDSHTPWRFAVDLLRDGVPVALSARYPAASWRKLRFCASMCFREGISQMDALRMITSTPARIVNCCETGVIREGAAADLCIYNGDPLLLATSHLMTVSAGRVIMAK